MRAKRLKSPTQRQIWLLCVVPRMKTFAKTLLVPLHSHRAAVNYIASLPPSHCFGDNRRDVVLTPTDPDRGYRPMLGRKKSVTP